MAEVSAMSKESERRRQAARLEAKPRLPIPKTWELVFTAFLAILPFGWSQEVPLVPWGLVCLVGAWIGALHLALTFPVIVDVFSRTERLWWAIGLTLALLAASSAPLEGRHRKEISEAPEGYLFLESANATRKLVQVGQDGNFLPEFGDQPLYFFADASLKVENENGHLLLSTIVRDFQGKEVVRIDRNHWRVNSDRCTCLDKNYTNDSLEVRDIRDHIVLQVRLYPDHLSIQGEWFNDHGEDFFLVFNRRENKTQLIAKSLKYDPRKDSIAIEPIFKYPSAKHWAEWDQTPRVPPPVPPTLESMIRGQIMSASSPHN